MKSKESKWKPVATEESLQINDSGNPTIDQLARIRVMQNVWSKLEDLFPACKTLSNSIWLARKSGDIKRALQGTCVENLKYGPRNKKEWEQLAHICVETALNRKIEKQWIYENLTPSKIQELEAQKK